MIGKLLAFLAPAAFGAFVVGWSSPPVAPVPLVITRRHQLGVATIDKPGAASAQAAAMLARAHPPPPPPKPTGPPPAPKPAPPPPPDISVLLRAAIRAVVPAPNGKELGLIIAGPGGARVLHPGDVYEQGWRVTSVTRSTATLKKNNETRAVSFFAPQAGA